jgi:hypothetical protein
VAHVVHASSALAIGMKMGEKCKCAAPSAMQVKHQWKTISTEEKLEIINRHEKNERIVDVWHIRFAHVHVHAIRDNADRITESAKSGTQVFV